MAGTVIQVTVLVVGLLGIVLSVFVFYQHRAVAKQVSLIREVLLQAGPGMARRLDEGRSAVVMSDHWSDTIDDNHGDQ